MNDLQWQPIGKNGSYFLWQMTGEKGTIYNVTQDSNPPVNIAGYCNLEYLLKLKNLQPMYQHQALDNTLYAMRNLLDTPSEWQFIADSMPIHEQSTMGDRFTDFALQVARLGAYLDARSQGKDHESAVKYQNNAAAKVRKALGYSVARDDKSF